MDPILKAEHIVITYNKGKDNEFTALSDISLEIYPQEYVIFFGPSGCGKSTMLYTLLGVQTPSSGKIFVNGQDSSNFSEEEKCTVSSQFFGIVFQNFNLIYSLNVEDNVMLPQVFVGVPLRDRREKGAVLMERFGIATRAHNLPNNLSGGQQQRVAICRALINDPQILLADEPVGNLDSESARVVMQTLSEINRNDKKTIILVTHDPNYLPFANRVYYFKDGKLEKVAVNEHPKMPDEVLRSNAVKKEVVSEVTYKEMERMARVHSSLSVGELKAWILTQYLHEELTVDQMERLEKNMEGLLSGEMTRDEFRSSLDRSFKEGGVGLYKITAEKYAEKVSQVIDIIGQFKNLVFNSNHEKRRELTHLLRKFVLSEYEGDLSYSQVSRLERAIVARVNQEITAREFMMLLEKPVTENGVQLRANTAKNIGENLEVILAAMQNDRMEYAS